MAGRRRPLDVAELARLGLAASIGGSLLFSIAVGLHGGAGQGILCLLATAALAAVSIPLVLRDRAELFEPIWLTVLTVAIGVTGKAFYVVLGPRERVDFLLLGKRPEELTFAALIVAGGLLLYALGYLGGGLRWRIPGTARFAADVWEARRFTAVVGILVIGGLLSVLLFVVQLDLTFGSLADLSEKRFARPTGATLARSGVHGYLRWGAMLLEIAFLLVFASWAASRRRLLSRAGLGMVAVAMLATLFPILVSSRTALMLMILRALLVWLCIRGRPKPRSVAMAAAAALLLAGSMLALRRNQADWQGIREHLRIDELMEVTVGGRHFLDLTKTGHILEAVPSVIDYQYGRTLATWILAPIPRSLWPDKPQVGPGLELGALFGVPTSGVPPGFVADLYLNFGVLGVAVGMLGLGLLMRSLLASCGPHFPNKAIVLIFCVLSTRLAFDLFGGSVAGTAARVLMETIPLALALAAVAAHPTRAARP